MITEGGHIKLTDFGGCRPITQSAHESLSASKSQLGSIRDGDWKDEVGESTMSDNVEDEEAWNASLSNEDGRVEGTVAYCAPEIVRGEELPSFLSDVWSLGCVAYFLLRGRLPFFHDTVEGLKHSIVNFIGEDFSSTAAPTGIPSLAIGYLETLLTLTLIVATHIETVCGLDYPGDLFPAIAREFICKLLQPVHGHTHITLVCTFI